MSKSVVHVQALVGPDITLWRLFQVFKDKHTSKSILYNSPSLLSSCRSLKDNIIRSQPIDKQQTMAQWFDDLMCGIERNVSGKNKEKYVEYSLQLKVILWVNVFCIDVFICRFTQNLSSFRRDVVNLPKSSSYNTGLSI